MKELTSLFGQIPELSRGKWEPWTREGRWELTSLGDLHVNPHAVDFTAGLAAVTKQGEKTLLIVRLENLKKYKRRPDSPGGRASSTRKAKALPSHEDLQAAAMRLIAELGLE